MSRLFPNEHLMPRQNCAHEHKARLCKDFSMCVLRQKSKIRPHGHWSMTVIQTISSARLVFPSSCANSIHQPFLINFVATYEGWEFSVRRKRRTRERRRMLFGEFPFQWHQQRMLTCRWRSESDIKGRHWSAKNEDAISLASKLIKGLIESAVEA